MNVLAEIVLGINKFPCCNYQIDFALWINIFPILFGFKPELQEPHIPVIRNTQIIWEFSFESIYLSVRKPHILKSLLIMVVGFLVNPDKETRYFLYLSEPLNSLNCCVSQ